MDYVIKSWIASTISTDLVKAIVFQDAIACNASLAFEDQFLGNQETRTLHLDAKFGHFC
jgi:hypothetical protein